MDQPKQARGRPKVPWKPLDDEFWRRITTGQACETVEAEAEYLEHWAKENGICSPSGLYIQHERIRERIKKRYHGSAGYKQLRQNKIQELIRAAKELDLNKPI